MTIGKTSDIQVWLATASAVHDVTDLLGMTLTGDAAVTSESFLNKEIEQASVHAGGTAIAFSSMYDTARNAAIITGLLGTSQTGSGFFVESQTDGVLEHFQLWPVDFAKPGLEAPAADAITRPWAFSVTGRGAYGFRVVPFTTNAPATVAPASYDRGDDPVLYVLTITPPTSGYEVSDGSADTALVASAGLQSVDLSDTDQTLSIDGTGTNAVGFAFVGHKELVASG